MFMKEKTLFGLHQNCHFNGFTAWRKHDSSRSEGFLLL